MVTANVIKRHEWWPWTHRARTRRRLAALFPPLDAWEGSCNGQGLDRIRWRFALATAGLTPIGADVRENYVAHGERLTKLTEFGWLAHSVRKMTTRF